MEKLKEKHHDHSFTECLKNIIFGLVMLAPFISIGIRCGYVMWNKNAKDSYSDVSNETEIEYTQVQNKTDFEVGKTYTFTNSMINTPISSNQQWFAITCDNVNVIYSPFTWINSQVKTFRLYKSSAQGSNSITLYTYDENNITLGATTIIGTDNTVNFTFTFLGYTQQSDNYNLFSTLFYETNEIVSGNTLDNAFSYSVSQISNDPIFNWTRNTGIYQPINAMVQGLEIENDTLQILLAYWSLMTAVYIVFDLIIFCFTKITHFING